MTTNSASSGEKRPITRGANRVVGGLLGALFIVAGVFGLFIHHRAGVPFAGDSGTGLISASLFQVNKLHSLIMLGVGIVLAVGALAGEKVARTVNIVVGVAFIAFAIFGMLVQDTSADNFAFDYWDGLLYGASGVLLLIVALIGLKTFSTSNRSGGVRIGARVASRVGR